MDKSKQKKIFFILGSMGRGGAERVISILSQNFADKGWITQIGLLLFNKVDYKLDESTQIFDFTGNAQSRILRTPYWLYTIRKFVKKEQPDVVISFAARITILVLLATLGLRTKVIISERNDPKQDGRGLFTRCMVRLLYPFANKIVFQTKRSLHYFSKKILQKGIVIPNPISVSCHASSDKKKKIVSVGRLTKQKNHALLIKAFATIKKIFPEYELYIYGDGELLNELISLTKTLGIDESVHFEGNVPDVHEKIADAELFVLSSDYEGLSNALLEALMMGLHCISTNVAGADEYIENGRNGILVSVGDEREMSQAIRTILGNQILQKKFSYESLKNSLGLKKDSILIIWNNIVG